MPIRGEFGSHDLIVNVANMSDRKTSPILYDELPDDVDFILQVEIEHLTEATSHLHKEILKKKELGFKGIVFGKNMYIM